MQLLVGGGGGGGEDSALFTYLRMLSGGWLDAVIATLSEFFKSKQDFWLFVCYVWLSLNSFFQSVEEV